MSKHRLYSDTCGQVTVKVEPNYDSNACAGKYAVDVSVSRGRGKAWRSKSPICMYRDPGETKNKRAAAETALSFYEDKNCPVGLSGTRRRRRR